MTERLEKGLIDFGLIIEPANIYKYNHLSLPYQDLWGIYINKEHPLALKESITPQDLIDVPLLCSSQELKYKQIENWANPYFSKYHIIATYNLIYNASILTKECNGAVISLKNLIDTSGKVLYVLDPLIHKSLHHLPLFGKNIVSFLNLHNIFKSIRRRNKKKLINAHKLIKI